MTRLASSQNKAHTAWRLQCFGCTRQVLGICVIANTNPVYPVPDEAKPASTQVRPSFETTYKESERRLLAASRPPLNDNANWANAAGSSTCCSARRGIVLFCIRNNVHCGHKDQMVRVEKTRLEKF